MCANTRCEYKLSWVNYGKQYAMHFQAQFGQLIDDLLKNGVKSIDNTQYYITYDQRRDAQKKCLTVYASIYVNV